MAQQEREGASKQLKIEDMSGAARGPMSARERIAAENPATHNSPAHQERMRASYEAARKAAEEAQKKLEELQKETEEALPEPIPEVAPEPISQPVPVKKIRQLQSDLRQLVLQGRVEEDVEVSDFIFTMRTLTSRENGDAAAVLGLASNELQRIGMIRNAILARSIQKVNGVPLEAIYEGADADKLTAVIKKEKIIGDWQQTLVTELMLKYDDLLKRSQEIFTPEAEQELKN